MIINIENKIKQREDISGVSLLELEFRNSSRRLSGSAEDVGR